MINKIIFCLIILLLNYRIYSLSHHEQNIIDSYRQIEQEILLKYNSITDFNSDDKSKSHTYNNLSEKSFKYNIFSNENWYNSYLKYKDYIEKYSIEYRISLELIVAIIKNESGFNPYAKSQVAYGLMQIVPNTGGLAAHSYIYGISVIPKIESLYLPEYNIKYGVAYIHKLKNKYFNHLNNYPEIQELCIISAYNAGPTRILNILNNVDIKNISITDFYKAILEKLPKETKIYLQNIYSDITILRKTNEHGDVFNGGINR